MAFLKLSNISLVALAVLVAGSRAAWADATMLVCHYNVSFVVEDSPTTVEMNEAQKSIAVHFGAQHYNSLAGPALQGTASSGASIGPMPAVFSTDTVTFSNTEMAYTGNFVINRTTGEMVNTSKTWRWTCQLGKKQF